MANSNNDLWGQYIETIQKLERLNRRIQKKPMCFYGEAGKEIIMATKDLHILGGQLLRFGGLTKEHIKILKKIPFEKT
jgi:hypothetical protein